MPASAVDLDYQSAAAPTPLTILTGFLGAGKTTLLNRILNGNHGLKAAVLVNDFGAINIDAELIVGIESNVVSLANGCICCTIRDDLVATLVETLRRPEKPEYVLLEASGIAEPAGIAMTFNNPDLRERIRLDSILCVVDAEQIFAAPELMELKMFQMACADMIVLNKVDLVDGGGIAKIKTWLDNRFHRYRLLEACHANVPLEILLSVGCYDPASVAPFQKGGPGGICAASASAVPKIPLDPPLSKGEAGRTPAELHLPTLLEETLPEGRWMREHNHATQHNHRNAFSTWSYETDQPLLLEALRDVAAKLPANIYRAKGVIYASEAPERRALLQVVGSRVDISLMDRWGERTPRTQIVAIGAAGAIDGEALQAAFEQCAGMQKFSSPDGRNAVKKL